MCDVEADTLTAAVVATIHVVHRITGLRVIGLGTPDAVTLGEAALRLNGSRTQSSLRQLATGERGPGGFPAPVAASGGKVVLYSFAEIVMFLRDVIGDEVPEVSLEEATIDMALRLIARGRDRRQTEQIQAILEAAMAPA
ncbi:hypothetical protein [Rhizohabitans arisaemae]|uniref:hypothetical protein n=1 Tax=Rhizohabitans arisaemae TaxID=2720610 RepID=UPI0024B274BA|nr:hypothetical protein [Rhizohabitans arisaemae]